MCVYIYIYIYILKQYQPSLWCSRPSGNPCSGVLLFELKMPALSVPFSGRSLSELNTNRLTKDKTKTKQGRRKDNTTPEQRQHPHHRCSTNHQGRIFPGKNHACSKHIDHGVLGGTLKSQNANHPKSEPFPNGNLKQIQAFPNLGMMQIYNDLESCVFLIKQLETAWKKKSDCMVHQTH